MGVGAGAAAFGAGGGGEVAAGGGGEVAAGGGEASEMVEGAGVVGATRVERSSSSSARRAIGLPQGTPEVLLGTCVRRGSS